jgi:histidyl-tRNA synthetase
MREANKHHVRFVIIIGETELAAGKVSVRPLDGGEQVDLPLSKVVGWMREQIGR